jgi:hypothetical protein
MRVIVKPRLFFSQHMRCLKMHAWQGVMGDADNNTEGDYDVCDQDLKVDEENKPPNNNTGALRPSLETFSHAVDEGLVQVKPVMEKIEKIVIAK